MDRNTVFELFCYVLEAWLVKRSNDLILILDWDITKRDRNLLWKLFYLSYQCISGNVHNFKTPKRHRVTRNGITNLYTVFVLPLVDDPENSTMNFESRSRLQFTFDCEKRTANHVRRTDFQLAYNTFLCKIIERNNCIKINFIWYKLVYLKWNGNIIINLHLTSITPPISYGNLQSISNRW